jgi:hypothetical protein
MLSYWSAYQQIEEQSELGDARMKNLKVQCVALEDDNENPIHCPFCGIKIARGANEEEMGEWIVGHCEHLLFAAVDGGNGYEYRSKRFDDALEAVMSKKPMKSATSLLMTTLRRLRPSSKYPMRSCSNRVWPPPPRGADQLRWICSYRDGRLGEATA